MRRKRKWPKVSHLGGACFWSLALAAMVLVLSCTSVEADIVYVVNSGEPRSKKGEERENITVIDTNKNKTFSIPTKVGIASAVAFTPSGAHAYVPLLSGTRI